MNILNSNKKGIELSLQTIIIFIIIIFVFLIMIIFFVSNHFEFTNILWNAGNETINQFD